MSHKTQADHRFSHWHLTDQHIFSLSSHSTGQVLPPHSDPPSCNGLLIRPGRYTGPCPTPPVPALSPDPSQAALSSELGIIGTFYLLGWGLVQHAGRPGLARWAPHTGSPVTAHTALLSSVSALSTGWLTGSHLTQRCSSLPFYLDSHGRNWDLMFLWRVLIDFTQEILSPSCDILKHFYVAGVSFLCWLKTWLFFYFFYYLLFYAR